VLISQLIVAPVLLFEVWFYLELARRRDPDAALRAFDAVTVAVALLACLAWLPLIGLHESGGNERIWRPVLSVLSTFFTFPCVLLVGLTIRPSRR
jgi:hypothetical protein